MQKLVDIDDLSFDITATTFVTPDEASLFDVFLPHSSITWSSSVPHLMDNIYEELSEAQHKHLNPDSKIISRHLSDPHLAAKPQPSVVAGNSLPGLTLPNNAPLTSKDSSNVPQFSPNHYIMLSYLDVTNRDD